MSSIESETAQLVEDALSEGKKKPVKKKGPVDKVVVPEGALINEVAGILGKKPANW